MVKIKDKKSNVFIITLFILIILVSLVFTIMIYFDIDETYLLNKYYNIPNYDFNDDITIFIETKSLNKMNYAYENLNQDDILCLYGTTKNNNIIIDDVDEYSNECSEKNYIGNMRINKNEKIDVYDIECGLNNNETQHLKTSKDEIISVMCDKNWFGFYNNESKSTSYKYNII